LCRESLLVLDGFVMVWDLDIEAEHARLPMNSCISSLLDVFVVDVVTRQQPS